MGRNIFFERFSKHNPNKFCFISIKTLGLFKKIKHNLEF